MPWDVIRRGLGATESGARRPAAPRLIRQDLLPPRMGRDLEFSAKNLQVLPKGHTGREAGTQSRWVFS